MNRGPDTSGVLLVDKPLGPTSFDVVRRVRRALKVKAAGHTGTLDPAASGLLPVCLGDATRIATFLTDGDKEYEGVVRFGATTDTLDAAGEILEQRDASHLTLDAVEAAVAAMLGPSLQAPPMYSARRVDGKRLHQLAREGVEVEREARPIVIHAIELLSFAPPEATIRVRASKGTYIRVIAQDLGEALGCGAHLAALRRTGSGNFQVADALPLERVEEAPDEARARLLTVEQALSFLPALQLDERHAMSVAFGNPLDRGMQARLGLQAPEIGGRYRLLDPAGNVVAVGEANEARVVKLLRVLRAKQGPGGAT